jgi:hypothetical protein
MPRRLDERLKKVAFSRQVSIKTARDWRDSSNDKWFMALKEIEAQDAVIDMPPVEFNRAEVEALDKAGLDLVNIFPLEGFSL